MDSCAKTILIERDAEAEERSIDALASDARHACGCERCVGPQPHYGTSTRVRVSCMAVSSAFYLSTLSYSCTRAAAYRASCGWTGRD